MPKMAQLAGDSFSCGKLYSLFIHPKLQNDVHHAPRTTIQAVTPPSGGWEVMSCFSALAVGAKSSDGGLLTPSAVLGSMLRSLRFPSTEFSVSDISEIYDNSIAQRGCGRCVLEDEEKMKIMRVVLAQI